MDLIVINEVMAKRYLAPVPQVSHWGNIAVEEHYQLVHTGAKLKSQFSRLDFQRNPIGQL